MVATTAEVGLSRLYAPVEAGTLPPRSRDEIRASIARPDTVKSTIDEYVQSNTAMEQAAQLTDFGSKPLVVLTAGREAHRTGSPSRPPGSPVDEQRPPHRRWGRS